MTKAAPKTRLVARKNDQEKVVEKQRNGWRLPPEEGTGWVNGTGAQKECILEWERHGWVVTREVDPHWKPTPWFRFAI